MDLMWGEEKGIKRDTEVSGPNNHKSGTEGEQQCV